MIRRGSDEESWASSSKLEDFCLHAALSFPGSRKRSTRESGSASRYTSLMEKSLPQDAGMEEVEALLSACDKTKPRGLREINMETILELLYSSGLRVGGLVSLEFSHLDLENEC